MRLLLVLAVTLCVAGCKKSPPPEAPPAASAPAVQAPAVAPKSPTSKDRRPSPSALSVFEPREQTCQWRSLDPMGKLAVNLASFPGSCVGVKVTWSPDASKAVVWFDPRHVQSAGYFSQTSSKQGYPDETADEAAKPRAFVVDLKAGKAEPLPLPSFEGQTLSGLGVDASGAVLALLEQPLAEDVVAGGSVTVGGETFDLSQFQEGLPELAHAVRFEGGAWKRVETKATTTGWDYALGVKELEASRRFGAQTDDLSSAHAQGDAAEGEVLAALEPLKPKKAGPEDGAWMFLGAGGARLYVWEVSGEFAYTTGLLATGTPTPKVLPKLGFTDGDLVSVRTSGPFVLVTASNVGAHPRLYQLPEGTLLYASDTARGVTFWPTSARPDSHEAPGGDAKTPAP